MPYIRIDGKLKKLTQTEYEAMQPKKTYAELRQKEYGSLGEQLDEIFHSIDSWKERIQSIKDKYPKE